MKIYFTTNNHFNSVSLCLVSLHHSFLDWLTHTLWTPLNQLDEEWCCFCDRCVETTDWNAWQGYWLSSSKHIHVLSVKISFSKNFLDLIDLFVYVLYRIISSSDDGRGHRASCFGQQRTVQYTLFGLFDEKITIN